ncbi:glycosyl hydrolase [Streptomyces sp. B6B3]|uniref:glycosyl hydrolase n=1 Tax=Streptomyces sp. B6B3 TaxID=3153570 RepID=UPI00325DFB42
MTRKTFLAGVTGAAVAASVGGALPALASSEPDDRADRRRRNHSPKSVTRYEAEDADLTGNVTVATAGTGFSGAGYVTGFSAETDTVRFTIESATQQLSRIKLGYRTEGGYDKTIDLNLNDTPVGGIKLTGAADFTAGPAGLVLLEPGGNTVTFGGGWGHYDMDYLDIEPSGAPSKYSVNAAPVNPNASSEARTLLRYLADQYGHQILSGQQGLANAERVYDVTGLHPAILGIDFGDYSPSRVERYDPGTVITETENALAWHQQGGLLTASIHWNAPTDLIDEPGKEWWRGFYTDSTTFDIEAVLADPDSERYQLLLRDIDAFAVQLQRLQAVNAPLLFRPLHEADGTWFWWGAKGPGPCIELYHLMYDRLTNHHGINNLLWVWNSADPAWYPGDSHVDIVSYDSYLPKGSFHPNSWAFEHMVNLVDDRKIVAMSENGENPSPDLLDAYQTWWSWFNSWGEDNSDDHLQYVFNHSSVITRDDLPAF